MGYPRLKWVSKLNQLESGFKRCPSLVTQCSQNKIISLYWETKLTFNWAGVVFAPTVSAHSDLFSVNMDPEKTYGLEINPLPSNRSQVLSALESSTGLTYNYRSYSGINTSQKEFLSIPILLHFHQLLGEETPCGNSPFVLQRYFYFLPPTIVWRTFLSSLRLDSHSFIS